MQLKFFCFVDQRLFSLFFPLQFFEFYVNSSSLCLYIKESTGFFESSQFSLDCFLTVVDCTKKAFTPSPIRNVKMLWKFFCHYLAHFFEFWHTFLNFHMKQELSKLKTSKFPEKNWNHLNYCQIKEYFCPIFQKQLPHIATKSYHDFLLNTRYITKTFVSTRILTRCHLSFFRHSKGPELEGHFHSTFFYFLHILSASCKLSHFLPNILVIHMSRHSK